MKHRLIVRPEAERDITESALWYEERSPGLGADFLRCVDASIAFISRNPLGMSKHYKEYRHALLHRFPYGVFYVFENQTVVVTSVLHLAQDPQKIKRLLDEL